MDSKKLFVKNRPIFVIGFLYTVTALIVVISAWIAGIRRFDLGLTISRYVGTRQWTTVFYLIVATVMTTLGIIHLKKSGMGIVKKILYLLAFAFVWGCAVCPFNREWSDLISNLHQCLSLLIDDNKISGAVFSDDENMKKPVINQIKGFEL